MTNHDKNMRTLVLCFVLAIMALIPLRFTEVIGTMTSASSSQVLGDTVQIQQEEVVLPNAELSN